MKKYLAVGFIFGFFYLAFEVLWTALSGSGAAMTGLPYASLIGKSSLYMFPLGFLTGIILGMFNENSSVRKNCNVFLQSLLGAVIITAFELISGLILNVWLGFNIWSYTVIPFNFLGQICLFASIMWFLLNPFIYWLDDMIRYFLFDEGHYYEIKDVYKDLFHFTKKTIYQAY